MRSVRIPPGLVIATTAPPAAAGTVASSWASAITSPRADSPAGFAVLVISTVIDPITWLAIGTATARYGASSAVMAAFGTADKYGVSTGMFVAVLALTWPLVPSMVRSMSVKYLPLYPALVTSIGPVSYTHLTLPT